ncbi:Mobile element protein [Richelia intracellularis]|nr:Mobile element protein [Richelia intracellularis]
MICTDVGFDAGKQIDGRKRFIMVELLRLVLRVLVNSASVPERAGAKLNVHVLAGLSDER